MHLNLDEFERAAVDLLSAPVYDYYAGAADDEITLAANRHAFQRLQIAHRVLVDVSTRTTQMELLGIPLSFPVILAPTALHRMAHTEGENATARAAASAGTLMTLSSISSTPMEEVAAAAPGAPRWFQVYHLNSRAKTEELIGRAADAGYSALVLTVDTPLLGRRERDLRNPFMIPDGIQAVHFMEPHRRGDEEPILGTFINQPHLTWTDLTWLRSLTDLPLILKGIVRADDARRAVDHGIAAVWVSNHGGRQLDTSVATADALPEVVGAITGQVPVIVDGGVRRGTDVLKALALGADAVAIGRSQLWGLAAGGQEGVETVLRLLKDEFSLAMALAGCAALHDITPDLLRR